MSAMIFRPLFGLPASSQICTWLFGRGRFFSMSASIAAQHALRNCDDTVKWRTR